MSDEERIILTDTEWWRKVLKAGTIYARVGPAMDGRSGSVRVELHPGTPDAPAGATRTHKSLELARRVLAVGGYEKVR